MGVDSLEVSLASPSFRGIGRPIALLSLDGLAPADRAKSAARQLGCFAST